MIELGKTETAGCKNRRFRNISWRRQKCSSERESTSSVQTGAGGNQGR